MTEKINSIRQVHRIPKHSAIFWLRNTELKNYCVHQPHSLRAMKNQEDLTLCGSSLNGSSGPLEGNAQLSSQNTQQNKQWPSANSE